MQYDRATSYIDRTIYQEKINRAAKWYFIYAFRIF